ncbi:MAG TPA: hypothetical protein VMB18_02140 [Terriglobales bacterium]|nr:hypothetical protein [Terriglobales bacterium]
MRSTKCLFVYFAIVLGLCCASQAQQTAAPSPNTVVPQLVNFSGRALDSQGKPMAGLAGLTFAIYKDQFEGAPLWLETQNVQIDGKGNYTVQLGTSRSQGLPLDLFASGEARWLGVRINGGEELPRVLLLSVPYALKAADAQTLGGLPASAFILAAPSAPGSVSAGESTPGSALGSAANVGGTGTQDYIPIWTDNSGDLGNSILYQTGSGSSAKIGINLTKPLFTLDVNGQELVRGLFEMATQNFASKTKGYNSNPINLESSAFNSGTNTYTLNHFQWQAEPVGNNTTSPGATLNLLYGQDPAAPTETGLSLNSKGVFTFSAGQTFPGAGTVTSVGFSAPSSDFTVSGSPITKSGTLSLAWKVAPTNADTANAIVKRDSTGSFSAGQISGATLASTAALYGLNQNDSAFAPGVQGEAPEGIGVYGLSEGNIGVYGNGAYIGVNGVTPDGYGVWGDSGTTWGVYGHSNTGQGIVGEAGTNDGEGFGPDGVDGVSHFSGGSGLAGFNFSSGDGVYATSDSGYAGYFAGDVHVNGNLSKNGGSFKIDHPLDPANKYLYHSFVESPDMMNIYNGNAVLDAKGEATIQLPDWFETLNRDFRYQLTSIGGFAPVYIAQKVQNNSFKIAGGKQGMEVSWQVTGIRQDKWANAHRIPVEQKKDARERGYYLNPELYGAPINKRVDFARHPGMLQGRASPKRTVAKASAMLHP